MRGLCNLQLAICGRHLARECNACPPALQNRNSHLGACRPLQTRNSHPGVDLHTVTRAQRAQLAQVSPRYSRQPTIQAPILSTG